MIKDQEYLTSLKPLKFYEVQIKFDSKEIVLTKKSHIDGNF